MAGRDCGDSKACEVALRACVVTVRTCEVSSMACVVTVRPVS